MNQIPQQHGSRWQLIRDLAVFQFKLLADGLRDLIMSPVSLIAGLSGLLFFHDNPSKPFHDVLALGKRSERWINLFGALPRKRRLTESMAVARTGSLDDVLARIEQVMVEQYEKGGLTASAKSSIDFSLDALARGVKRLKAPDSESDDDQPDKRP